jgi:hypothetical protein
MCKKASRQLNILKRIGKYMNRLGRQTFYYSFILSNFNYCPVIWHYCSKKNGFLFRSEFFFRTTQELEYLFFLSRKARNFFPEFNIRLYDKNSESDYFFFLHQNQNIFFSNIGNQNIFLEKNITPPLQVKWSFPYEDLLQKFKLPSLKIRRIRTIAIETFKIIHRKSPQYLHDLVDIKARSQKRPQLCLE